MKHRFSMFPALAIAALATAVFAAPSGASTPLAKRAGTCVASTNIEAIIDDSGSMEITDPNTLRVKGLKLLISTLPATTSLGAVEFGGNFFEGEGPPAADTVFGPEPVGANAAAMAAALEEKIKADNGGTDYNAAFAQSDADNPGATARIFLTDGGHDIGTYNNGHNNHKVPTYVIGFGVAAPEDAARLQAIASETGGQVFALEDSSDVQSVMNTIGADLTCQTPPTAFTDKLAAGASKTHTVAVGAKTKSLTLTLTWADPADKFAISGFKVMSHGKLLAKSARRHVKHISVKTSTSETFSVVKVSGLTKGKLSFKVKALSTGTTAGAVTLTTQVGKSSK